MIGVMERGDSEWSTGHFIKSGVLIQLHPCRRECVYASVGRISVARPAAPLEFRVHLTIVATREGDELKNHLQFVWSAQRCM